MRSALEERYGADNVRSSTVPKNPTMRANSDLDKGIEIFKNELTGRTDAVKVQFKDPLTNESKIANIAYDARELPIFDDVAKFTTEISKEHSYKGQMSQATKDLRDAIETGKFDANKFTEKQLKAIKLGSDKIPEYTWHHNAQASPNNMQLVPTTIHKTVLHIGQNALSQEK